MRKLVNSNYRILTILRLLNEKPHSIEDLCLKLDIENQSVAKRTITKYFSILRDFGCIIEKRRHKFALAYTPFQVYLTGGEIDTLALFYNYSKMLCQDKRAEKVKKAILKILKCKNSERFEHSLNIFSNDENKRTFLKYEGKIRHICRFLDEKQVKIKIYYRQKYYTITPKNLKYIGNKVHLYAFDENSLVYRRFLLDDIEEILNLNQISTKEVFTKPTLFKLKGRVAKGYTSLYPKEIVISRQNWEIVVENKVEDKEILLRRLMKYCEFCEIISPKEDREKFNELTASLIKKYEDIDIIT